MLLPRWSNSPIKKKKEGGLFLKCNSVLSQTIVRHCLISWDIEICSHTHLLTSPNGLSDAMSLWCPLSFKERQYLLLCYCAKKRAQKYKGFFQTHEQKETICQKQSSGRTTNTHINGRWKKINIQVQKTPRITESPKAERHRERWSRETGPSRNPVTDSGSLVSSLRQL